MFSNLNEYLIADMSDDYWYDEVLLICQNIIMNFSKDDWSELLLSIPKDDTRWCIRLVESLNAEDNSHNWRCVETLLRSDNVDLFVSCVDYLRDIHVSLLNECSTLYILQRINEVYDNSPEPTKKIFEVFAKKYSSY